MIFPIEKILAVKAGSKVPAKDKAHSSVTCTIINYHKLIGARNKKVDIERSRRIGGKRKTADRDGEGEGADRFGFAEELGHEFGGLLGDFLLVGDCGVGVDFEDWHCEEVLGS